MMITSVIKKIVQQYPCTLLHPVFPNDNIIHLALLIHIFALSLDQPTSDRKHSGKKFRKVPKAKLNLPCTGNYLHNICIVFTTTYKVFDIISNLEVD